MWQQKDSFSEPLRLKWRGKVVSVSDGRSDLMVDRKVVTPLFLFKQSTKTLHAYEKVH
jgi:hypothetical protein